MKVTVIGGGVMGNGIAQVSAMSGHDVVLHDLDDGRLDLARAAIDKSLARLVKSGKLDDAGRDGAARRIRFDTSLPASLEQAEVVIEAVLERLDVKHEVFRHVATYAPDGALLGTNTSQLSITSVGRVLGDRAPNLIGMHFFNPPVMMRLVELVRGLETSDETLERARAFSVGLGKETVVCRKDSPGFLTSRIAAIIRLEALHMLDEELASAEDIDRAIKLAFNHPMGPLELGDFNGLDTYLDALNGLHGAHGERFRPTVGLKNMVAAGYLGRKSGRGFYEYDAK